MENKNHSEVNINHKRESEEKFKSLFYSLPEAVVYVDDKGKIIDINPKFTELFGYTLEEIKGKDIDEGFLHPDYLIEEGRRLTQRSLKEAYLSHETVRKRKDGKLIHVNILARPVKVRNKVKGVLVIYQDISERKKMEEDIKYKATHDSLTDLANRNLLKYIFDLESARAKRERKKLALVLIDLYNFKDINDRFGHDVGDIILKGVAKRFTDIFRKSDIIFRIGGDEFVILLTDIKKNGDLNRIVLRIVDSFKDPIKYKSMKFKVGLNIGIAMFPDDGEDLDTLLKKADIAMYTAKDLGPNSIRYFNENLMKRWVEEKNQLRRRELRYRTIFENSPFGVALIDKNGEILNVNQKFLKIIGRKRGNLISKNITDIFPCNEIDSVSIHLDELKYKAKFECETYIERNGEKIFLNVYISPILNPYEETEVEYLILMVEDITDKKRLEEELKLSLKKFRNLFENAPLGINLTDKRGMFLDVNPQWEKILGYKKEEVVGKKTWMDITHPEDLKRDIPIYQKYLKEIKDGKTFTKFITEKRLIRKNGTLFWARVTVSPAFNEKGNFLFEVATIEDISLKKEKEVEREVLFKKLEEKKTFSDTLRDITLRLTSKTDLNELFKEILIQAKRLVPFVSGNISLVEDGEIVVVASTGYEKYGIEKFVSNLRIPIDKYPTDEKILETKEPLVISDTSKHPDWITYKETEWIKSHVAIPIILEGRVIGFFKIDSDRVNTFTKENADRLLPFANTVAIALRNARLLEEKSKEIKERIRTETQLKESYKRIEKIMKQAIDVVVKIIEFKDPYTAGHQKKVSNLAVEIAKKMGLSKVEIEAIRIASLIHDIGKVFIPSEILMKPGSLTNLEFELIKAHPKLGHDLIKNVESPYPIHEIILEHHERLNGSGYPRGLKGDEIMIEARILAVADVIEAMTSHRPYRPALGIDKVLEEIKKNKGILYDPKVVEVCVRLFEKGFRFE